MRGGLLLLAVVLAASGWYASAKSQPQRPILPSRYAMARKFWKMAHHPETKGVMCVACTVLVDGVQIMLKQNKTDDEIENFVVKTCETLGLEQNYVCEHFVHEFGDEAFFVLERVIFKPAEICGALVEDCGTAVNPLNQMWNLTMPGNKPKVKAWPNPSADSPKLKILHITDIHVDRHYVVGSEAKCEKGHPFYEYCCVQMPGQQPATVTLPAGKWGMPNKCDIPFVTFENSIKQIAARETVDMIYLTGDMEAHNIWDYTKDDTMNNLNNVSATIRRYFPNTPIYETVGNHEGVPMDAMAYHGMEDYDNRGPSWLYNTLANNWKSSIPDTAVETVKYRASYSMKPFAGFKLISLNSIYCSMMNLYNYINQVDPDGTLNWLIKELMASEQAKEKVHIISHIPPGDKYCLKGWSHNFYRIVNRFESTISAMFYGHTHQDHYSVYYEDLNSDGRATQMHYIAPSLTTYSYNNPAYTVYTVDGNYAGSSYVVLDKDTYSTDLLKANADNTEPVWFHTYSAKNDYGMADLSPASWNNLITRMETDDDLWNKYIWNYARNDHVAKDCGPACRKSYLCDIRSAMSHDQEQFCNGKL